MLPWTTQVKYWILIQFSWKIKKYINKFKNKRNKVNVDKLPTVYLYLPRRMKKVGTFFYTESEVKTIALEY